MKIYKVGNEQPDWIAAESRDDLDLVCAKIWDEDHPVVEVEGSEVISVEYRYDPHYPSNLPNTPREPTQRSGRWVVEATAAEWAECADNGDLICTEE